MPSTKTALAWSSGSVPAISLYVYNILNVRVNRYATGGPTALPSALFSSTLV
jgi:hypothetical protein